MRLMTPTVKYWVCKTAPAFLYEAMECLGGNGYVEESALPRLYREAPVNAIWEGSGNVMALDVGARAQGRRRARGALSRRSAASSGRERNRRSTCSLAAARVAVEDEGSARLLVEQLALTAAAAALRRDFPPPIADAFIETRLGRPWRSTYGMLDGRFNARKIVDYIAPATV